MNVKKLVKGNINWDYVDASASKLAYDLIANDKEDWRLAYKRSDFFESIPKDAEFGYYIHKVRKINIFKHKFVIIVVKIIKLDASMTIKGKCAKLSYIFCRKGFSTGL